MCSAWLVMCAVLLAQDGRGEEPATRPAGSRLGQVGGEPIRLSPQEREEAVAFAREHMPRFYEWASRSRGRERWRLAVAKYRVLQGAKDHPGLRERMLKQVQSEDALFEYVLQLEGASQELREQIRDRMRQKMRDIVQNFLDERARRIQSLRRTLELEEQKLDEDRRRINDIVERRLERFLREMPSMREAGPRESGATMPAEPPDRAR